MPSQTPDQEANFLVDVSSVRSKRAERQAFAQLLSATRRAGAELSQAHRNACEAGGDCSPRLGFERDMTGKSGGKSCRHCPSSALSSGSAQAGTTSGVGVNRIEFVSRQRPVSQSELDGNIVKPARREAAIEMPQSRNDHSDNRYLDVGTRLIEHKKIETLALGEVHAGHHLLAFIETTKRRAKVRPDRRLAVWHQIGMVLQAKRNGTFVARCRRVPDTH